MSDINTLREALFDTLTALRKGDLDLDRAHAINETAQTLINTAKIEVDMAKVSGRAVDSGFIKTLPALENPHAQKHTATGIKVVEQLPAGTVTTHRLRG